MAEHQEGFLQSKDGLRLFWQWDTPDAAHAKVMLVHGYAEHIGRYQPFIQALLAQNIAVFGFDYRGHGRSGGRRGHCKRFSDYLDDLQLFVEHVAPSDRRQADAPKWFLLGHSHGGLMAIHQVALRDAKQWAGLILSSPYLRLALTPPPAKVLAAKIVGKVLPWLPFKNEISFDQLTRDREAQARVSQDPLYNRTVTPRWFSESTRAQLEALQMGPSITLPTLVVCGEKDPIASTPTTRSFFDSVGAADKNYQEYPGMLHETLNEIGKEEVWRRISHWISDHS